jgi:hypothetical protein
MKTTQPITKRATKTGASPRQPTSAATEFDAFWLDFTAKNDVEETPPANAISIEEFSRLKKISYAQANYRLRDLELRGKVESRHFRLNGRLKRCFWPAKS